MHREPNTIQTFLPRLIDNDQTGFLRNRFIGENIRLVDNVINYANIKQIPGLLQFTDFEKAFDSLEWSFIEKTLNYYNFGSSLVAWIRLFYTDISSCVQNNGIDRPLTFSSLSGGVRQGCPLSPYLFILCAEVLGNSVRNDTRIQGIKVLDTQCKLSQYADDTTFILDRSQSSFFRNHPPLLETNIMGQRQGIRTGSMFFHCGRYSCTCPNYSKQLVGEKTYSLGQNHHNKVSSRVSNSLSVVIPTITPKNSLRIKFDII